MRLELHWRPPRKIKTTVRVLVFPRAVSWAEEDIQVFNFILENIHPSTTGTLLFHVCLSIIVYQTELFPFVCRKKSLNGGFFLFSREGKQSKLFRNDNCIATAGVVVWHREICPPGPNKERHYSVVSLRKNAISLTQIRSNRRLMNNFALDELVKF